MTWIDGHWEDNDVLSDELVQTLDFSEPPPPLDYWLISEEGVRQRLGDIYEDMLMFSGATQERPLTDEMDALLRLNARRYVAAQILDQACTLLKVEADSLP